MLRRATALEDEDDERNYAANKEARDQEYRNQFAARIFAFSGGKVLATMKPKGGTMLKRQDDTDDDDIFDERGLLKD